MENKNTQKSGDNSNQVQIGTAVIVGITEERARAIIKEQCAPIIESYNEVAREIAQIRSEKFENLFIPTLVKAELLESLKKPEIILAIQEAERQAICTDEEKSYDILSKLLLNRIKYSSNKLVTSSLKKATEVAIEIADESLIALTIIYLIVSYYSTSSLIKEGLEEINELFGLINTDELPSGRGWLEQLDVLKLVRMSSSGKLKKIIDLYYESYNGYVCVGIKKDTANYNEAVNILTKVNLTEDLLITHELNEDYVRLPISSLDNFSKDCECYIDTDGTKKYLSKEQKKAYEMIIKLYEKDDIVLNENKQRFIEIWNQFPNLVKVRNWWDNINVSFDITIVGLVLAYTNINNINISMDLPKLELKELLGQK